MASRFLLLSVLLLLPLAGTSQESVARVLVKFRAEQALDPSLTAADQSPAALARRIGLKLERSRRLMGRLHYMQLDSAASAETVGRLLARLRADPGVEYAEPDRRRRLQRLPNDPLFFAQWYLQEGEPAAIRATSAWDLTVGSSSLVVAVLDTGVRFEHPDLRRFGQGGRLLPGFDFVSGPPANDNDGDSWDPDPSDPGDWISEQDREQEVFKDCQLSDSSWHGTRVSGIIGARSDNAEGVTGISWQPLLLPVRVLGKCGGYDSDIIPALRWAAGMTVSGAPVNLTPARIINLSLGADGACSQAYRDVFAELNSRGVLVVASAGNDDPGRAVSAPANCPGVLGVAAVRHSGTKVGFSNFGPEIGISAPGGNCGSSGPCQYSIDTTTNTGTTTPAMDTYTNQFNVNVGTSFSAPIVVGVAALVRSVNSRLTPAQTILRLQQSATAFPVEATLPFCQDPAVAGAQGQCNCTLTTCGAGMVNAGAAVLAALRPFVIATATPTSAAAGQTVHLQGSDSFAADQREVQSYFWTVVSSEGATPIITGANLANASFSAPSAGLITVRLTVTDSEGMQDFADVIVTTPAAAPPSQPSDGSDSRSGGGGGGGSLHWLELLLLAGGVFGAAARRALTARNAARSRWSGPPA